MIEVAAWIAVLGGFVLFFAGAPDESRDHLPMRRDTTMSARRSTFDAIAEAKREGGARLTPAMPPADTLRQYVNMRIADTQPHDDGIVLVLSPIGHMGTRLVLLEGVTRVVELAGWSKTPDPWDDSDEAQHADDIGDEIHERERYAERDVDVTPAPPEHSRRPW